MKRGDLVRTVHGLGRVADVDTNDGQPDYLVTPIDFPRVNYCGCGQKDCHGSNWFRAEEIEEFENETR